MAIPDFQTLMLPLLEFASDGEEHMPRDAVKSLIDKFQLTPEEQAQMLPSGRVTVMQNRVAWANVYMKKAGLLEAVKRGVFRITARGKEVLAQNPARVDMKFLEQFPEFIAFRDASANSSADEKQVRNNQVDAIEQTPEETLELAHQALRQSLSQELLKNVLDCSPEFFEHLVVELLVKMGYGGSRRDAGERIGRSGDGGIDGIIKEDRLGLDVIYIQAKRWQGSVGRPEIQKFVGALQGQRARKGVFITTSTFTTDALDYASRIDTKVVLIDGNQLANLMMDFDVGVSAVATYTVKRIDSDYFEEA